MLRKLYLLLLLAPLGALAQIQGDYTIQHFPFQTGDTMSVLRLHYRTLGTLRKDNAVLIMHGTTGEGTNFLNNRFAGRLFGAGQLLDTSKYFIILPDGIGHGKSSKPSDGLHMRFPRYTYDDMVLADYRLLTEHLGVNHLRLCMGTSMGGMHTWVWGYTYPDFMDALMPLASLPVMIAGRNRMERKMGIECIENDPEWHGGDYKAEPKEGMRGAISVLIIMGSSPLQLQKAYPTRAAADSALDWLEAAYARTLDANDMIYALDASRFYDPSTHLGAIKAVLYAINSADDHINPPELPILDEQIKKVPKGRYILLPITDQTSGHGTHSNPAVWGNYLADLLRATEH
jgi:homoserine O-acetyltransferase